MHGNCVNSPVASTFGNDKRISVIPLPPRPWSCANYGIGFLKFERDGKDEVAEPMGTRTFVKLGRLCGILTAWHVLEKLGADETVCLVRFPSARLNLGHTQRVADWNGSNATRLTLHLFPSPRVDGRDLENHEDQHQRGRRPGHLLRATLRAGTRSYKASIS
jgi:hypothetical protein